MTAPGKILRFWSVLPDRSHDVNDTVADSIAATSTQLESIVFEGHTSRIMHDPGSMPLVPAHFRSIPADASPAAGAAGDGSLAQEATFRMPSIPLAEEPSTFIDVGFEGIVAYQGMPVYFRVPSRDEDVLNVVISGIYSDAEMAAIEELLTVSAGGRSVSAACEGPLLFPYKVRVKYKDGSAGIEKRYKIKFEGKTVKVDLRTYGRRLPDGTKDRSIAVTVHGNFVNERALREYPPKRVIYPIASIGFEDATDSALTFRRDGKGTDIGADAEVYWAENYRAWIIDNVRGRSGIFYRTVGGEIRSVEPGTYVKVTDGHVLAPGNGLRWEALVDTAGADPQGIHGSITFGDETVDARFTMHSLSGKGAFVAAGVIGPEPRVAVVEEPELTLDGSPTMIEDGMITVRWTKDAFTGESGWMVINYRSAALWYQHADADHCAAILPGGNVLIPDGSKLLPDRDAQDPQTWLHSREIRLKSP